MAPQDGQFASISELQQRHAALLGEVSDPPNEEDLVRVGAFLRRAAATGTVLDNPDDRRQAQGLIDYWGATLQSQVRLAMKATPPKREPVLLAEFVSATLDRVVASADRWLATLAEADRATARRVIMRLIRLDSDNQPRPHFGPRELFDDLEPASRTREIVDELLGLGVLRLASGPSGTDQVGLRSEQLLGKWETLQGWLKERTRFREHATRWRARSSGEKRPLAESMLRFVKRQLVSVGKRVEWLSDAVRRLFGVVIPRDGPAEVFEDATYYRDRNPAVLDYAYYVTTLAREEAESRRVIWSFVAFLLIVGLLAALVTVVAWRRHDAVLAAARKQQEDLDKEKRQTRLRLKELVGVVRRLAEYRHYGTSDRANVARAHIADLRSDDLAKQLLNDEDQRQRQAYREDLDRIGVRTDEKSLCAVCSPDVTRIAGRLRSLIDERAADDEETKRYFRFLAVLNRRTVQHLVEKLAQAYGANSGRLGDTDAGPYLDELMILRLGETEIVGDPKLTEAMSAFVEQVRLIDAAAFASLEKEAGLELLTEARDEKTLPAKPTVWQRVNLYKTKNTDVKSQEPRLLLAEQATRPHVKAEIDKLRKLKDRLLSELAK